MKVLDYLKDHIVYLDGGMGTLLQAHGLKPGEFPERWNISQAETITAIHRAYYESGSNIVCANTFGANSLKFEEEELYGLIRAAVENAKRARAESGGAQEKFIALDVGPVGKMLKPYGDLDFEEAVSVHAKTIRAGAAQGVDLIIIETMNDSYETKAALLAARENSSLPVFVSNAYGEDGKLMTGASPEAMVAMLEGMGADAIGANCSLGPAQLRGVVEEYLRYASVPVLLKPNAGLPEIRDGRTCYDVLPAEFSGLMEGYLREGVRIAGGCCGTTPDYIRSLVEKTKGMEPRPLSEKERTVISSYTHAVEFGASPVLIGERINPTGKKRLKEALRTGDINYVLDAGIAQQENGAHALDVNVGLPEIDEAATLRRVCSELQAIIDLPLQIDTADPAAMEGALRRYNGKAMVNSVNGKKESMEQIFPLVKKYGGVVVCLTLDDKGIPESAEGRVKIAEDIIAVAAGYGIKRKDLIFDPLAMAVSADSRAPLATLASLREIRNRLGCHTLLGVSNVSFGLPERETVNAAFFAAALENGLSAAILNPASAEMMKIYYSFRLLHGLDDNCADYIGNIGKYLAAQPAAPEAGTGAASVGAKGEEDAGKGALTPLQRAVVKGLKEQAAALTASLLETEDPLELVSREIVPALDIVGQGFENKTCYLPQLLMSAEAAQSAFERIKAKMEEKKQAGISRGRFVIATVRGDIHDIGKNIVRLILENYGFEVTDLGKDVPPESVAETVKRLNAPLVGLSALMTTTIPAMEETVKLVRKEAPGAKILVGGAVLTEEYASGIGADFYGRDAMAAVRYAIQIVES
ncbi:MAG: homocysteine S-methyltransferase family protein [Bacillota bacterium]|nr:homocysteine S-methyltransferase family protein [Bacillota bacterium]